MIIDSHTHAWEYWPYDPPVPDHEHRGKVENLLWEMDRVGVDQAVLVCARIDHNPGNNDYVAGVVQEHPDRLIQFADVDCSWSDTYHRPGAAGRLRQAAVRYGLKGFTHYVKSDTEWFTSQEGLAFFEVAAEMRLIASLALGPQWQPALRDLAARFPTVPFLCHHMAGCRADDAERLAQITASASVPNICVKMSGFHYVSETPWGFPFPDCRDTVRGLYDAFGPERLFWGSDYPVVRTAMTYQQALEALRACDFIPEADLVRILGGALADRLATAGT